MAGGITQSGIVYLLDLMRGGEQPVVNYYVAVMQQLPPGFTIGGEELDEPSFTEYARGELSNDSASWLVADNVMSNLQEVTFPTALQEWGQIKYWAVCDQPQGFGGRVLFCGEFDELHWVEENQQLFLGPGELMIDISGNQWLMSS